MPLQVLLYTALIYNPINSTAKEVGSSTHPNPSCVLTSDGDGMKAHRPERCSSVQWEEML